ncbi:MAG TPA: 23S rRNA (uracil(1939)-C(5))-methyltransferase RlmD [Planctomycetota bacterium]|nr:23S rRNA (uracil(1939)-C(5))-methyltransferase RlmD [Planctomycetota bacterium]
MSPANPRAVPVERGDRIELEVDGLGDGPDGIGHIGRYVVFVPGVLPGERASVRITSAARKFGRAELLAVQRAAPERVAARCAHFLACGGCHRQHQAYAAQLADKQMRLQRAVSFALGDDAPTVAPPIPAASPFGQRHKVVVHLRNTPDDRLEACFHRLRSPELVAVHECPASEPRAWALAMRAVALLHELPHGAWDPDFAPHALLRSVLVRTTTTGHAHLLLVARAAHIPGLERLLDDLHDSGATTISVNGNDGEFSRLLGPDTTVVSGPPRIAEQLAGATYLLSPNAFFQTSPHGAQHLIRLCTQWLAPTRELDVADLYCGGGLLTLALARTARSALGVELSRTAIDDAQASARHNGVRNVAWRSGHADSWLAACRRGDLPRPHLVAMDPPRSGLGPAVIEELRQLRPRRLAYVSCEPQALQRDLRALAAAGFRTRSVQPIDMFPQTCHVEAVACLERAQ